MGQTNQERINLATKALAAGVQDAFSSAVWYEARQAFSFISGAENVWTDIDLLRALPAANLAAAQANAIASPLLIEDLSAPASAVRLSVIPGTNFSTYVALTTFGDFTSPQIRNWILPQLVPQASGAPSTGYSIQLYDGDPNAGGVLISTTVGTTGTGVTKSVGWIFNYASGLLLLSDDFFALSGITPSAFDPYIVGFRYTGGQAGAAPDVRGPTVVVGNSPAGDTADNCDFLDSGNGAAIQAAVAATDLAGGGTVFIRRGTYDFDLAGSPGSITSFGGVGIRLQGEGRFTVLRASTLSRQLISSFFGFELFDLTISVPSPAVGAFIGGFNTTLLDPGFGVIGLTNVSISCSPSNANEAFTSLLAASFAVNLRISNCVISGPPSPQPGFSLLRLSVFSGTISNCTLFAADAVALTCAGSGFTLSNVSGNAQQAIVTNPTVNNFTVQGGSWTIDAGSDTGFDLSGSGIVVSGLSIGTNGICNRGLRLGNSGASDFCSVNGCTINGAFSTAAFDIAAQTGEGVAAGNVFRASAGGGVSVVNNGVGFLYDVPDHFNRL